MNEDTDKEKSPCLDKNTFLAEIERLYIEGYPTRDIAQLLGVDGNKVGRNLREIKRRWARAAGRQRAALSQTQCAAVYREAMLGWQKSQQPKLTTTEHRDADGKAVKTAIRRQEGPGDKTFLLAAVSALKTVRQFAADRANAPLTKDGKPIDEYRLALLQIIRPEQVEMLDSDQRRDFRESLKRIRAEMADLRRQAKGRQKAPAGSPAADEAGPPSESAPNESAPSESAPQESGGDSAPSVGEAAPRRPTRSPPRRPRPSRRWRPSQRRTRPRELPLACRSPQAHAQRSRQRQSPKTLAPRSKTRAQRRNQAVTRVPPWHPRRTPQRPLRQRRSLRRAREPCRIPRSRSSTTDGRPQKSIGLTNSGQTFWRRRSVLGQYIPTPYCNSRPLRSPSRLRQAACESRRICSLTIDYRSRQRPLRWYGATWRGHALKRRPGGLPGPCTARFALLVFLRMDADRRARRHAALGSDAALGRGKERQKVGGRPVGELPAQVLPGLPSTPVRCDR